MLLHKTRYVLLAECHGFLQYCHNHGYYGLDSPKPNGLSSVLGHFRENGYAIAAIGKIHCPEYKVEDDCDLFFSSVGGRPEYEEYLKDKGILDLEDHISIVIGDINAKQSMEGMVSNIDYEDCHEGWITTKYIEFVENANNQSKQFLYMFLFHDLINVLLSEPFWSMYEMLTYNCHLIFHMI